MVTVRAATPQDSDQLALVKPYWGNDPAKMIITSRLQHAAAANGAYLIAILEGRIVGHVFLKFEGKQTAPDYPDVEDLYVHDEYRRQGVASALMRACETIVAQHGFNKIGLAAGVDENGPERLLYQQLGYTLTGSAPYVDGVYNGVEDWVVDMVKAVNVDSQGQ